MKCESCGTQVKSDEKPQNKSHIESNPEQNAINASSPFAKNLPEIHKNHNSAYMVDLLLTFLGWITAVIGLIFGIYSFISAYKSALFSISKSIVFFSSLPGLGVAISGLVLVAIGQLTKSTTENSDYIKEILISLSNSEKA